MALHIFVNDIFNLARQNWVQRYITTSYFRFVSEVRQ